MTAGPDITPVLDLGSIRLELSNAPERLGVDEPFPAESMTLLKSFLGRLESAGGLPRFLFVTSPSSIRDAGLCAIGLARAASSRGMEVLLVDFSFERPVLKKPFPYQPEEGVTDMVLWGASLHAALRKTKDERIRVIGAGSPPPDPEELGEKPEFESVLGALRGEAELVIGIGPVRRRDGGLSFLVRKSDRTLLVGSDPKEERDLAEQAPAGRIARIGLQEEFGETDEDVVVTGPAPRKDVPRPVPPKKGFPVLRVLGLLAVLSIVLGVLFSRLYLDRRSGSGDAPVTRRTERPMPPLQPGRVAPPPTGIPAEEPPAGGRAGAEVPEAGTTPEESGGSREEAGPGVPAGAPGDAEASPAPAEAETPATTEEEPVPREEVPAPAPIAPERAGAGTETGEPAETAEAAVAPAPVPEEAPPVGAEEIPAGEPYYGVHVESFPTREDAERAAARFRGAGEIVTIVEKNIPDKGTWYRILLGRFATAGEAQNHGEEVKAAFGLDYGLAVRVNP
ncbi:MAG: SPOR domain-containing protein [Candidatus Eisenbacteria bacterium]